MVRGAYDFNTCPDCLNITPLEVPLSLEKMRLFVAVIAYYKYHNKKTKQLEL